MTEKSVITCDLEGRIETFNEGAAAMFGWPAEEIIGKKRVSAFSPGLIVLGHVGGWLQQAVADGAHEARTVFVRKDGTPFAADIRITPTFKNGAQIGYCGVTVARPEVPIAEAMPKISLGTKAMRWLVVTRAPFLAAMIVPILLGATWVHARGLTGAFPWGTLGLVLAGGILLHLAANTFNDYFDWTSGTDPGNTDYFLPFSGGSRSIELGLIGERGLLRLASVTLALAVLDGAWLVSRCGTGLLWFGLAGAFSAVFYTAPPLRLAARRGLGELFVGLNFGPLVTAGTAVALTGTLTADDFFIGLPLGLFTASILWINEFPDAPSDARAGKNNLVVTLGLDAARWGFAALLLGAFGAVAAMVGTGRLPAFALVALLAAPLGVFAAVQCFRHARDRQLVKANAATVQLQVVAGLLLIAGLFLQGWLRGPFHPLG